MAFNFRRKLTDEYGEIDEVAARHYLDELTQRFAESPEGAALAARGITPGVNLDMFFDYLLRYVGQSPGEMDADGIDEALGVFAEKVTGRPDDLDQLIPELEAFCDFAQRAFSVEQAASWKREIQRDAEGFREALRDRRHWGMAKSMMMEGLFRGFNLSTEKGINEWMLTTQAEQLAATGGGFPGAELAPPTGETGDVPLIVLPGGSEAGGPFGLGPAPISKHERAKEKARRKQQKASRRRNRR